MYVLSHACYMPSPFILILSSQLCLASSNKHGCNHLLF
jgi:hypothetical protein